MKKLKWKRVKWPFNDAEPYASWDCWQYGNVILYPGQWPAQGWSYVASFGPNDDRSHSGFLPSFVGLESAKDKIESKYAKLAEK